MQIPDLCPAAEDFVRVMHLNPTEEGLVKICIAKYSYSDHQIGDWLKFRVKNIIKRLCGQNSQWQETKNLVSNRIMEMAINKGLLERNPSDKLHAFVNKIVKKYANCVAEQVLRVGLDAQEKKYPVSESLTKKLQELDFADMIVDKKIREVVNKVFKA